MRAVLGGIRLAALMVVVVALGLPMATLHGCDGGQTDFTGLQFAFVGMPPLSLLPLVLLSFCGWAALRRDPDAPDSRQLLDAARYTGAAFAGALSVVLPGLANLGGETVFRWGGWVLFAAWGVAGLVSGVAASLPMDTSGPDPWRQLRRVNVGVRWVALGLALLVFLVGTRLADWGADGRANAAVDYAFAAAGGGIFVVLPWFFVGRGLEARARLGRRGGGVGLGLALAGWAVVFVATVAGVVVDELDRAEARAAEEAAAAEAAEAAAEAEAQQR